MWVVGWLLEYSTILCMCITFVLCYMTDHHVLWSASKLHRLCDQCLPDHFLSCQHHCWLPTNVQCVDWSIALSKLHKNIHDEDHRLTAACYCCVMLIYFHQLVEFSIIFNAAISSVCLRLMCLPCQSPLTGLCGQIVANFQKMEQEWDQGGSF